MKENTNSLKSILKDLKETSKYLTEDYIFNDKKDIDPHRESLENHEKISDNEDEIEDYNAIRKEPIIEKIREIAIDGLKKYSKETSSPIYEFFKKVFLESDKVFNNSGK